MAFTAKHIFAVPHGMGLTYLVLDPTSPTWYRQYDSAKRARALNDDLPVVHTTEGAFLNVIGHAVNDMLAQTCPFYGSRTTPQGATLCSGPIVPSSGLCQTCHNNQPT